MLPKIILIRVMGAGDEVFFQLKYEWYETSTSTTTARIILFTFDRIVGWVTAPAHARLCIGIGIWPRLLDAQYSGARFSMQIMHR